MKWYCQSKRNNLNLNSNFMLHRNNEPRAIWSRIGFTSKPTTISDLETHLPKSRDTKLCPALKLIHRCHTVHQNRAPII